MELQHVLLLSQSQSHYHTCTELTRLRWPTRTDPSSPLLPPITWRSPTYGSLGPGIEVEVQFFFNISSKLKGTDSGVHSRNIHTNVTTALLKLTKRRSKRNFPISPLFVKVTSSWKSSWPRQPAWLSDSQGKLSDCPSLAFPSPTTRPYLASQQTSSCQSIFRQCLTLNLDFLPHVKCRNGSLYLNDAKNWIFLEAIQIQNLVFTYVYPQISNGMKIFTTLFSKFVVLDENVRLLWKVKWCFHVRAKVLKVSYIYTFRNHNFSTLVSSIIHGYFSAYSL